MMPARSPDRCWKSRLGFGVVAGTMYCYFRFPPDGISRVYCPWYIED